MMVGRALPRHVGCALRTLHQAQARRLCHQNLPMKISDRCWRAVPLLPETRAAILLHRSDSFPSSVGTHIGARCSLGNTKNRQSFRLFAFSPFPPNVTAPARGKTGTGPRPQEHSVDRHQVLPHRRRPTRLPAGARRPRRPGAHPAPAAGAPGLAPAAPGRARRPAAPPGNRWRSSPSTPGGPSCSRDCGPRKPWPRPWCAWPCGVRPCKRPRRRPAPPRSWPGPRPWTRPTSSCAATRWRAGTPAPRLARMIRRWWPGAAGSPASMSSSCGQGAG